MKKPTRIAPGGLLGLACPCSIAAARPRALQPNMQLVQQESLPYVQASSRNILCGLHGLRICSCAPLLIEARPSSIAIFSAALHRTLRARHPHLSGRLTSSPVCLDSVCAPCDSLCTHWPAFGGFCFAFASFIGIRPAHPAFIRHGDQLLGMFRHHIAGCPLAAIGDIA